MNALLPSARFRSPTAVSDKSDIRDENVYSALVVQHTGSGSQKVFNIPQGQTIPKMNGSVTSSTAAHHATYTDLTTNLTKAGELGATLGDGSIRAVGITIEQAAYTAGTGLVRSFGAGAFEVADILSKTAFELRVGGKRQMIGPTFMYPGLGVMAGQLSVTANAASAGVTSIGGNVRRLKVPIPVARNDTLEGVFSVATGAALAFALTTGEGSPTLIWFTCYATVKGDVR